MSEQKVGDLFLELGVELDQSSWSKAQKQAFKYHRDMQRRLDNLELPTMQVAKFGDAAKRAWAPIAGMAARMAKFGVAAGVAGAGFAIKDALEFDEILADIDQSSGGAAGDLGELRKQMLKVSTATNVAKESVAAGAQTYITLTGDAKTATAAMDTFAKVAFGQKTDMADVATVAATMGDQFGLSADQFEKAFSILASGAKAGSVEFRDMAGLMASLGANFALFGESQGLEGISTLGAAFQVAKKSFGTASEAATGLESLMGSLQQNAAKLKKDGKIDVFEADGKTLRPLMAIIDEIASKDFNGSQLFDLLGRKESVKTLNVLTQRRKLVDDIARSSMKANDIQDDFNRRQQAPSARVQAAWNEFKNKIAEALTPERIEKFAMAFESIVEAIAEVPEFIEYYIIGPIEEVIDKLAAVKNFFGNAVTDSLSTEFLREHGVTGLPQTQREQFAAGKVENQRARLQRAAGGRGAAALTSSMAAIDSLGFGSAERAINAPVNITVHANGTDPAGVVKVVKKEIGGWWQATVREAAVGTGG